LLIVGLNGDKSILEQVREKNRKSANEIAHLSPAVKAYNQNKAQGMRNLKDFFRFYK
jgi:hypothetical protein